MKRGGGVSGAVSLVMIFCVLCLAVFAVLTIATADREAKLTAMTAQNAADYYAADRQAVAVVAALRDGRDTPENVVIDRTTSHTSPPGGVVTDATFSVPIGDSQALEVEVRLQDNGQETCEILRWQTVYTGEWEIDESMDVWDGGYSES